MPNPIKVQTHFLLHSFHAASLERRLIPSIASKHFIGAKSREYDLGLTCYLFGIFSLIKVFVDWHLLNQCRNHLVIVAFCFGLRLSYLAQIQFIFFLDQCFQLLLVLLVLVRVQPFILIKCLRMLNRRCCPIVKRTADIKVHMTRLWQDELLDEGRLAGGAWTTTRRKHISFNIEIRTKESN